MIERPDLATGLAQALDRVGPEPPDSVFRLEFDANGALISIVLVRGVVGQSAQACFERALRSVSWGGLPSATAAVEIELKLRSR